MSPANVVQRLNFSTPPTQWGFNDTNKGAHRNAYVKERQHHIEVAGVKERLCSGAAGVKELDSNGVGA